MSIGLSGELLSTEKTARMGKLMQYIESLLAQEPNQNSYDPTVNARLREKNDCSVPFESLDSSVDPIKLRKAEPLGHSSNWAAMA